MATKIGKDKFFLFAYVSLSLRTFSNSNKIPRHHSNFRKDFQMLLAVNEGEIYCNDPNFSDRQVWANSAYPDQTAPKCPKI